MGTITNPDDLNKMRAACQDAAKVLDFITPHVKPGVTTGELDRLCLEYLTDELKVKSATVGYAPPGYPPFPAPSAPRSTTRSAPWRSGRQGPEKRGLLNIDVTIIKDGWFGDTSRMYHVGEQSILSRRLTDVTFECMWKASSRSKTGPRWAISVTPSRSTRRPMAFPWCASSAATASANASMKIRRCCTMAKPGTGVKLVTGMLFTIEPMINAGRREIRQLSDGWTVVTRDHSLSAQWGMLYASPIPAMKC